MTEKIIFFDANKTASEKRSRLAELDAKLQKTDQHAVIGNVSNFILITGLDPELDGLLAFNRLSGEPVMTRAPPPPLDGQAPMPGPFPRCWKRADVAAVQSYVQRTWCRQATARDVQDAMLVVAAGRPFHPVLDWLDGLAWDGTPRLDTWMCRAFGVLETDYYRAVAAMILIAAVRRVRQPGCKFDDMVILEGPQGIGKSTAIALLFGREFFSDSLPAAIGSRDAAQGLIGIWVIEFGEIDHLIRAELETIKAFMSRQVDRFRAPYEASFQLYPRQCVFFGTTNDTGYLRDTTGNRRFYPVACQFVDLEWIAQNRTQLFAEAKAREAASEEIHITDLDTSRQAAAMQADRVAEDAWEERIEEAVLARSWVKIPELLGGLGIKTADQDRRALLRVADILRKIGWRRVVIREGGKVHRRWER